MAQADQTVQNATFPTVRADINSNLAALFSANSGNTAPSVTVAFQDWIDTSGADPLWKKRNAANNAWITVATITGSAIAFEGTLPSQSGQSGNFLTTNGTVASWLAIPPGSTSETFTSSGTWIKPASGNLVYVELWGGGGGGAWANNGGGGGGGAFRWALIPMAALSASESVTVGSGGAGAASAGSGSAGGSSSFAGIIAGGGGYGRSYTGGIVAGGGGGWRLSATTSSGGAGYLEFGEGMIGGSTDISLWVGAGGGDFDSAKGADSVFGGAGGGGRSSSTVKLGGTSLFGGDGGSSGGASGNPGGNGSIPGGGGGAATGAAGGNGGRGEVRIYVW